MKFSLWGYRKATPETAKKSKEQEWWGIPVEEYLKLERTNLARDVELFLMGRAPYRLKHFYTKHPPYYFLEEPCRPPLVRNWHNHFDNYGNFIPGYCGGISLGSWYEIESLVKEGIDVQESLILGFLINPVSSKAVSKI